MPFTDLLLLLRRQVGYERLIPCPVVESTPYSAEDSRAGAAIVIV
jgi:hypothetical protein